MLLELPAFPCPSCHERAFSKRPVPHDAPASAGTVLTHLYVCHACGENMLATVQVGPDRARTETWDYYLERSPSLRMVRQYAASGAHHLAEKEPTFVLGGEVVAEAVWQTTLASLRQAPSPLLDGAPTEAPARTAFAERWLAWWSATLLPRQPEPSLAGTVFPRPLALGTPERRAA